ncbi:MAG: putative ABC transporter permease [Clostridia bacterium]|nr:putative ABC transporter permease [Clostridia bacterium]
MTIDEAVLYFYIYSFLGWIYESILVSVREKRWANRGFLIGPICPIYGAGGLLFALMGAHLSIPVTFLVCAASSAVLEYLTGLTLEKLFHASWWDYSNMPLNLNGYICLPASMLFGTMGVAVSHFIHPLVALPVGYLPAWLVSLSALLMVGVTSADITVTVSTLSDFVDKLVEIDKLINQAIDDKYRELESSVSDTLRSVKSLPASAREKIIDQAILKSDITLTGVQAQVLGKIKSLRNGSGGSDMPDRGRIREFIRRLPRKKQ